MTNATQRTIARWLHIIFGLTLLGYVYGPPEEVLQYRPYFQFIFIPLIFITGLWMWKGHVITKRFSKKSA